MKPRNDGLTQSDLMECISYDPETGLFSRIMADGRVKCVAPKTDNGYIKISTKGRNYFAHRLAWLYVHGRWPDEFIDHINGDRSDNRIANLRECSAAQNSQNLAKQYNKHRLTGVVPWKKRFQAKICVNHKRINLGSFKTEEEAHAAYLAAKAKYHDFNPVPREDS